MYEQIFQKYANKICIVIIIFTIPSVKSEFENGLILQGCGSTTWTEGYTTNWTSIIIQIPWFRQSLPNGDWSQNV